MGRRLHTNWWRKRPKQLRHRQRLRRTQTGGSRRWRRRWRAVVEWFENEIETVLSFRTL